ncbi:FGGY-family carbohydrate kinase [Oryzibacter oryziterrae]|uniref:FGGY-family carbohydrate kinase n=1 Tax=Oryzibacter oryziterrae TaxID=2766474 RepID=UPI001F1FF2CB|nr:FGGY-family carbohydrate kinase [Oryzibacter oryziterrae]
MAQDILIGLDAGTSVVKAVAFSLAGRQLAVGAVANQYRTFAGGGAEQDMAATWVHAVEAIRQLGAQLPDLATRTLAIGVTGQGDGTWLIDGKGNPVGPARIWLDSRAAARVDAFRADAERDEPRYRATGTGLNACQQGAQLLDMSATEPERLAAAATVFHCKDWLYFRLTGERVTDPSEGLSAFGDIYTEAYSDTVLDALGFAAPLRALLPPILDGLRHADRLTSAAAVATGLSVGTPVVLGAGDVICAALGSGLHDPDGRDIGCTILGSTGIHMRLAADADAVRFNTERTGYTMRFPVAGAYAQIQTNMSGTLNLDWLVDLVLSVLSIDGSGRDRDDILAFLDRKASEASPGGLIYHPFASTAGERGPFVDASARAAVIGLATGKAIGDITLSVYEALGHAARHCYEAMGEIPQEIRVTGGASRSAVIRRSLGAILGRPLRQAPQNEAGALGAAMMAAVSVGVFQSMPDCVKAWVSGGVGDAEPFDPILAAKLDVSHAAYRASINALRPNWKLLAGTNATATCSVG